MSGSNRHIDWIAAVILNWKNCPDTLACLAAVRAMNHRRLLIVVIDNGSEDGSKERLTQWLNEEHNKSRSESGRRDRKDGDPVPLHALPSDELPTAFYSAPRLEQAHLATLIASPTNLGYAGGNNLGIRLCMKLPWVKYVWILNNDTIVEHRTLKPLLDACERDPTIGIAGSLIVEYNRPEVVDSAGGQFIKPLSLSRKRQRGKPLAAVLRQLDKVEDVDYAEGASLFLPRRVLEQVGEFSEDYFLYHEELDYSIRARRTGYRTVICRDSRVRHKVGASTGVQRRQSYEARYHAELHFQRSKFKLLNKHFPGLRGRATISAMIMALIRLTKFDIQGAWIAIAATIAASKQIPPPLEPSSRLH